MALAQRILGASDLTGPEDALHRPVEARLTIVLLGNEDVLALSRHTT